ncbi:YHYH protein [Vibrio amylolyticus]|uniref:YHYH protein n=1 Tax=Vibrio amylolyticus TaxID=2847292 RepID=UPI00354B120F
METARNLSTVITISTLLSLALCSVTVNAKENRGKKPPNKNGKPSQSISLPSTHIESIECTRVKQSIIDSGFTQVSVVCDNDYAYVQSDTYPSHNVMNGITGTNEQIPVPALNYIAPIKLHPQLSSQITTIDAALGIAVNGVPIYDYSAQGELDVEHYNAKKDTVKLGQLDDCGGHAGRGDDYHYHAKPTCMINTMSNKADEPIIGWGYDGYPIFADNNPNGSDIPQGTLDVCNGIEDPQFGYRYHTSPNPPYIIQCLVGEVDTSILPRVAPLKGSKTRSDLKPPREGVTDLIHHEDENGTRSLRYRYQGAEYFSSYTPSKTRNNCFDFKQKTISNGGKLETGTFCRQ